MRAVDYTYATASGGGTNPFPWPQYLGIDFNSRANFEVTRRWTPPLQTTTTQDGVTFSSYVNSYDSFARPLSVGRWSSLGYGKTDVTEYYDDLTHWVLGQSKRHYNADTGLVDSRIEYDAATALPLQTFAFEKLKSSMTYNADGTLATVKDGLNHTTNFSNWKRGIPQAIQYADGTTQSAVVDDNGWIRSVTDENGLATGYGYDAMGRVSGITYPNESNLTYNATTRVFAQMTAGVYGLPAGYWRETVQTGNRKKVVYYDGLWRPVVEENYDAGNVNGTLSQTVRRYDAEGHVVFASYPQRTLDPNVYNTWGDPAATPNALGAHTTYDALDRVTQVAQDSELGTLTTTTEYLSGFQVRTTNPRGYQTTNGYEVYDQPSYDLLSWSSQPEGKVIEISHNRFGLPLTIRQRASDSSVSATRNYVYDGYMQLCKTVEPETGATGLGYDAAGNVAWSASGVALPDTVNCNASEAYASGRRADRSYDARNRLYTLAFPDGRGNQTWTYTPDGLPSHVVTDNDGPGQGTVVNDYTYNNRRLLAGESVTQPGWYTWSLGYGFDGNASLSAQWYPTNRTVTYGPNALGQATQVVDTAGQTYASGVSYYPNGGISQFTYGNGIVHTMTQNSRQLPSRSTDSGGVLNDVYNYDANGNVGSTIDELVGAGNYSVQSRWMGYDGLDRLTAAGSGSFGGTDNWHRFTYSELDNLASWKLAGAKDYANYVYDASNRLTQINNSAGAAVVSLGYDAQGNLSVKNGQAYGFDYGNRLRGATNQDSYRYDGQGRRVLNTNGQGNIVSIYSRDGQLMYVEDYRRREAVTSFYLAGSAVARVRHPF